MENELSFFYNDRYKLLEFIYNLTPINECSTVMKCSQDEMCEVLNMNKRRISTILKELEEMEYISSDQKGKYKILNKGINKIDELKASHRKKKASKYKCASLFAGVGGIDLGFKEAGFETVYANEIEPKAVHTYEYNFDLKVDCRDIHNVVEDLENGIDPFNGQKFNVLLAGFPCQAFSIAGYREGFSDKKGRGGLFFEIIKIIHHTKPEVVFLENVKNLLTHDNKKTFSIIEESLTEEGYYVQKKVLNTLNYGNIPQNRERIYIVALKDKNKSSSFQFPLPFELEKTLDSVLDFKKIVEDRYYYTEKFLHFKEIKDAITKQNTVYQWRRVYVRENKNNVCPTLTANMGTGGHNVPLILSEHGIRKLLPSECFALQGFPSYFKIPTDITISHLYKQAGNSVSVSVIKRIAEKIADIL